MTKEDNKGITPFIFFLSNPPRLKGKDCISLLDDPYHRYSELLKTLK